MTIMIIRLLAGAGDTTAAAAAAAGAGAGALAGTLAGAGAAVSGVMSTPSA